MECNSRLGRRFRDKLEISGGLFSYIERLEGHSL